MGHYLFSYLYFMDKHSGTISFDYKGRIIQIPYTMNVSPGYGGKPFVMLEDKNGRFHHFVRSGETIWRSIGKSPSWPEEFLTMLYLALEEKHKFPEF